MGTARNRRNAPAEAENTASAVTEDKPAKPAEEQPEEQPEETQQPEQSAPEIPASEPEPGLSDQAADRTAVLECVSGIWNRVFGERVGGGDSPRSAIEHADRYALDLLARAGDEFRRDEE